MSTAPPPRRLRCLAKHTLASGPLMAGAAASTRPGQVVVITGCTAGLGLALAQEYIRLGHRVAGCGRRLDRIEALQAEHAAAGHLFSCTDVSNDEAVAAFAKEVAERFGDVDVLVCNAGMGGKGALPWDIPSEYLSACVDVGLKGLMYTCRHFIPVMLHGLERPAGEGGSEGRPAKRVVNVSSGIAHGSNPFTADYSAVKYAVEGYSKSVAQAFNLNPAWKGRILCVPFSPGVVRTEMQKKEEYPTAEVWCKEAAPYILGISPGENGSSLVMPGYYPARMIAVWTIPPDAKMNEKWELP